MAKSSKSDKRILPYQVITDRIITMLESDTIPWRKPWAGIGFPQNLFSGRAYRGINVFMLACIAATTGYSSNWWVTYRQAQELGGQVKKGEKSTPVVFWKILEYDREDPEDDEESKKSIPILKYYNVFNAAEQCEGLELPVDEARPPPLEFTPIEACESIVKGMPLRPSIDHGEPRAYYRPSEDRVNMPKKELFHSVEEYYSTLFHELVHATGHASRLNRESIADMNPFASQKYGKEELVAEMGCAYLCGHTMIEQKTLENSAAYISGWLKQLRGNPKLVVLAAAAAQKAADFILDEQYRLQSRTLDSENQPVNELSNDLKAR